MLDGVGAQSAVTEIDFDKADELTVAEDSFADLVYSSPGGDAVVAVSLFAQSGDFFGRQCAVAGTAKTATGGPSYIYDRRGPAGFKEHFDDGGMELRSNCGNAGMLFGRAEGPGTFLDMQAVGETGPIQQSAFPFPYGTSPQFIQRYDRDATGHIAFMAGGTAGAFDLSVLEPTENDCALTGIARIAGPGSPSRVHWAGVNQSEPFFEGGGLQLNAICHPIDLDMEVHAYSTSNNAGIKAASYGDSLADATGDSDFDAPALPRSCQSPSSTTTSAAV